MGREYLGDISGKFGSGIQSSCDIENLINISYKKEYEWYGCSCQLEEEELNKEKYCIGCYESYEDHYENVKEDIDEDEDDDNDNLFYETSFISYDIRKDEHYDQLIESLNKLKEQLPNDIIEEFEKIKDNKEIIDGYSDIFKDVGDKFEKHRKYDITTIFVPVPNINDMLSSFLRYKLGLQVKYVLEREGSCFMSCET
jgi:hypothetical protein